MSVYIQKKGEKVKQNIFSREERIILSAVELIDELGIDGLSIRELAKKEKVTEGALYRHFRSKSDIITEVIKYYSRYDLNIMNTINKNKTDAKTSILFFINSFAEYYENYPEITAVFCSFESLIYEPGIESQVIALLDSRRNFLISIIEDGKKSGEFKENLNSEDFTDIILGSFRQLIFKWRIEKQGFSIKKKSTDMIVLILESAVNNEKSGRNNE